MNKYQISLIIGITLITVGFSIRLLHAYIIGNILMAFTADSFTGFPYTHILTITGLPFFIYGLKAI